MKIKITALSNNIYQFADKTISDNSTGTWRGRITNAPDISRSFSDLGSVASTLYIQLINYDLQIPLTEDLWNASIDVETDNGYKWSGKVSAYETNADGKMYITATETTAPEYSRYIPDEFARLVSIDEDVHMSALNVTIPTVIGGNTNNPIPVKGILKSKSDAIYYLCIGEIHDIVNVRVGDKTMTRAEAAEQGYVCYTGSASQTNEPGIAYIQITDTSKRLNDDGSYVEIGAEVIGLKLGTHTVEECRNGARFLYWLLKTAASGACGWGLGISTNDIDTASFETAISYINLIGLKLDGVLYDNRSAQSWIDEICRAIRGTYEIGTDGKRRLTIDIASTSSYTYTKNNIELIRFGAGSFTGRVYNKGTLDYCYNPITGMFMQTSQYQNAESIARIDEQLFEGESYLIRDAETAQKILEYTCKKSLVEANKILFNTRFLPENCRIGTVITINYPEKGMNNSLFKITSLQIGDHINRIEAVKYDENIYTSGSVSPTVAWQNEQPIVSTVSVTSASGLTLNAGFDILPDGTSIASITGIFTIPNGVYVTAMVEYGETSSPSQWFALGLLKTNSFKISPVKVNTVYTVRVRLITSTGHSDYVTGSINTMGDSVAPAPPNITASTYLKTTRINVSLTNPPPDLAGFEIWRSNVQGEHGTKIGYVAATNGAGTFVDIDVSDYLVNYYYSAVSVDVWGNRSDYSIQALIYCAKIQANEVEADWVISNLMETARGVGLTVDGVKIDSSGIEGWQGGHLFFDLNTVGASSIGGWNIDYNRLYNNNIELVSDGIIRTMDFASGHTGWQLSQDGDAEFNNIHARGTIKTTVFEYDEVSVVGGQQMVRPGAVITSYSVDLYWQKYANTVLDDDYTVIKRIVDSSDTRESTSFSTYQEYVTYEEGLFDAAALILDDSSSTYLADITPQDCIIYVESYKGINVNDIIRIKEGISYDYWAKVTYKSSDSTGLFLALKQQHGSVFAMTKGQTLVDYGVSGSGNILFDGNSPKIDLFNHSGTPWISTNLIGRIGNLNGVDGITDTRYGFFFGNSDRSASNRHYIRYDEKSGKLQIQGEVVITGGDSYTAINTANTNANAAIAFRNAVANSNYTSIKGGSITTGIIKSSTFVEPSDQKFSTGSGFDLDNSHIHTPYFYSNSNGAGIKGYIEATSGKIGGFTLANGFLTYESTSLGLSDAVIRLYNSSGDSGRGFSSVDTKYTLAGPLVSYTYTDGWVFTASMDGSIMCSLKKSTTTKSAGISTQGLFATESVSNTTKRSVTANTQIGFNWYDANDSNNVKNLQLDANGFSYSNGSLNCYLSPTGYHQSGANSQYVDYSLSGNSGSVITFNKVLNFFINCKTSNKYVSVDTNGNISASGTITSSRGTCQGSSDENLKTNIKDIWVLNTLKKLRIKKWNYKDDLVNAHIGPMARDFNEAFDVNGRSSKLISFHDTAGIALRAVQELAEQMDDFKRKFRSLKKTLLFKNVFTDEDFSRMQKIN